LFAHFLGKQRSSDDSSSFISPQRVRLSCITFGAAPVFINQEVREAFAEPLLSTGPVLAIIIEGDPVPRLDASYFKILLHLMNDDEIEDPELENNITARPVKPTKRLDLEEMGAYNLGETVLLQQKVGGSNKNEIVLAYKLEPEKLAKYLFANIKAHKKQVYADWVEKRFRQ
jgi:hypothetical protein